MATVFFGPEPVLVGEHRLTWDVPEGWEQGRGAWGGMVVTGVVRSAVTALGSVLPVKSISVQILGPVLAGYADVVVEPLRKGSNTNSANVKVLQDGEVKANAVVIFGAARVPDLLLNADDAVPHIPPRNELPTVPKDAGAPTFMQHFELQLASGIPYTATPADVLGYCTPRLIADAHDAASLLGMVDCYWPSTITQVEGYRPAATLTFEAYLLVDPAEIPADTTFIHFGTTLGAFGGYAAELRRIWTTDGTLVAANLQLVAIIK